MTYDEFCSIQEDIIEAHKAGELTESQLEDEMEQLQNEWKETGEEY